MVKVQTHTHIHTADIVYFFICFNKMYIPYLHISLVVFNRRYKLCLLEALIRMIRKYIGGLERILFISFKPNWPN